LVTTTGSNGTEHRQESVCNGVDGGDVNTIRQVFASLSNLSESVVAAHTSMYQIGLDSLNAAQVASRLRRVGINVDATDVMQAPTPHALAARARREAFVDPLKSQDADLEAFDKTHRE